MSNNAVFTKITLRVSSLALLVAACTPASAPATRSVSVNTQAAVQTATPVQTTLPTPTALPSPTPPAWTTQPITADNAKQVVQVNEWGRGRVDRTRSIRQGAGLVVLTPLGAYVYSMAEKKLVVYAPGAMDFILSPDEKLLATSHPGGDVKVWNVSDGTQVQAFSHPIIRYAAPWKTDNPREDLAGWYVKDVGGLAFSPDSSELAAGYIDGTIDVWKIGQDRPATSLSSDILNTIPAYIHFSPDGRVLLVITGIPFFDEWTTHKEKIIQGRLSFWQLSDQSLIGYTKDPGFFAPNPFLPDGETAVTTSGGNVRLWNIPTGKQASHFGTNVDEITALEYAPDGAQITVTGLANGKTVQQTRKMPAGNLLEQKELPAPAKDAGVDDFLFAQGHYAALAGVSPIGAQQLRAWGTNQAGAYWLSIPDGQVETVPLADAPGRAFYAADQSIAWCKAGTLTIQSKDGTSRTINLPSQIRCTATAFSPARTYAAVWGKNLLTLVNLASGQAQDFSGLQRDVSSVAFSSDEKLMVSGSLAPQWNTAEVIFWQTDPPASLKFPERLDAHDTLAVAVSQDKTFAVSIGEKIRVWLAKDGNNVRSIDSYSMSVSLSPDDRLIASGDYQGDIHLWTVSDGSEVAMLKGDGEQVIDIGFTPDGSGLYTASLDGTVRLWGLK